MDLKAISRVLLLQSSNLWASAAFVVGKSIFLPLINRSLVLHLSPLTLSARSDPPPLLDFIASAVILVPSFKAMQA